MLTWLDGLDTLAVLLFIATGADTHVASFRVDTLLVLLGAHGLRLGALVHICEKETHFYQDTSFCKVKKSLFQTKQSQNSPLHCFGAVQAFGLAGSYDFCPR